MHDPKSQAQHCDKNNGQNVLSINLIPLLHQLPLPINNLLITTKLVNHPNPATSNKRVTNIPGLKSGEIFQILPSFVQSDHFVSRHSVHWQEEKPAAQSLHRPVKTFPSTSRNMKYVWAIIQSFTFWHHSNIQKFKLPRSHHTQISLPLQYPDACLSFLKYHACKVFNPMEKKKELANMKENL